jgi:ABC-type multidrug transport system ATPase subunit
MTVGMLLFLLACGNDGDHIGGSGLIEATETLVSAETSGRMTQRFFDEGSEVRTGDTLAVIDPSRLELALASAWAGHDVIEARLATARLQVEQAGKTEQYATTELERVTNLLRSGTTTQRLFDRAELEHTQAVIASKTARGQVRTLQAELATSEADIARLQRQLVDCYPIAPTTGVVTEKYTEPGELLSAGKPIAKIARLDTVWVKIYLAASEFANITAGTAATVSTESGGKEFTATVVWTSREAEFTPKNVQTKESRADLVYAVKVSIPNTVCDPHKTMSFLTAENLSKKYGDNPALVDFSLKMARGELFSLVGPDGAGKTTLIRILCHLLKPDKGKVTIDGHDIAKEHDAIKPILGYMPQQFSLYSDLSVEENLVFYAGLYGLTGKAYREKRDYLFTFSNLGPFAGRRAAALSGGMKQKLALSCALMHDPELLILDEPTTGVDPLSRRQFWDVLLKLKQQGVAILVSTPYMDEVARCDRACFILDGCKLSESSPAQLAGQFTGNIYYLDCDPSSQLVKKLNTVEDLRATRFGAGVHLYLRADDTIERHEASLRAFGIDMADVNPIKPGLEDRFIQLMEGLQ